MCFGFVVEVVNNVYLCNEVIMFLQICIIN